MTVGELICELEKMPQEEGVFITDSAYMLGISGIRPGRGDNFKDVELIGNYDDSVHDFTVSELIEKLREKGDTRTVIYYDSQNYYSPCRVSVMSWTSMPELNGKVWIC